MTNHLGRALGLPDSWAYRGVEVRDGVVVVHARLEQRPPATCKCEGLPEWRSGGMARRLFRTFPLGGLPAVIALDYRRYRCGACAQVVTPDLPLGRLTEAFEQEVAEYALRHTSSETCRTYALGREIVRRRLDGEIERRLAVRQPPAPEVVGIDDTMMAGARRAVLVDVGRKAHIDILPGYATQDVAQVLADYRPQWEGRLRCAVIDPYQPYRLAIVRAWPELPVVLDRYHAAMQINQAVKRFAAAYKGANRVRGAARLFGPALSPERRADWETHHPQLLAVYDYAQGWQVLYEARNAHEAEQIWLSWSLDMPDHLRPYLQAVVARLTDDWLTEICAAVTMRDELGYVPTNGITESLHKRVRIWEARASATSFALLRARVLLAENVGEQDADMRAQLELIRRVGREVGGGE